MTTDPNPTIDFRDPPPRQRGGRGAPAVWPARLAPLLDHPNRWACVHVASTPGSASSAAVNLRRGRYRVPSGRWEFRSAGQEVFARYLGPDDEVQP